MDKFTKIGGTIGPACDTTTILKKMVFSGMNFARLNFSHGDHKSHSFLIKNIREAEEKSKKPLAIMGDIRGPRIRLDDFKGDCITVKKNEEIIFVLNNAKKMNGEKKTVSVDAPKDLTSFLKKNDSILIDDGRIEVKVLSKNKNSFKAKVVEPGKLCEHKGLNFPDSLINIPPISEKDKADIEFCVKSEVDFIALSFVKNAKDIKEARKLVTRYEKKHKIKNVQPIKIIAKIERHEAVRNIDEIIKEADGIMVARGDLGLELKPAQVPLTQKKIIDKCNKEAKPVIVATQMLDSMQEKRRPTRAEVSDVANAVIDHADAMLLTNETAAGKHPELVVKTMSDIVKATERSEYDDMDLLPEAKRNVTIDESISEVSRLLGEDVGAKLILAASLTGETGRLISHVRPNMPILVATNNERSWRQLNLSWGVEAFIIPTCKSIEELVKKSVDYIKKMKFAKKKDLIIVVAGEPVGKAGHVNLVEVREVS